LTQISWAYCSKLAYEIIVIDDNSPDGTQEIVKRLQEVYGADKIVRLPIKHLV
jgi:glycosyltransferase involved in cell wall biosynthesis